MLQSDKSFGEIDRSTEDLLFGDFLTILISLFGIIVDLFVSFFY